MTEQALSNWIQAAAVVAAVFAAIVALRIAGKDRRESRAIAADDRKASLQQAKLLFDLELLLRLLENRNRGGSTDRQEVSRMGAEALTLVGMVGRERLPRQFDRHVEVDDDGLRAMLEDDETPQVVKDAVETQLAVNGLLRQIRGLVDRD